jgi:hypothetical protein
MYLLVFLLLALTVTGGRRVCTGWERRIFFCDDCWCVHGSVVDDAVGGRRSCVAAAAAPPTKAGEEEYGGVAATAAPVKARNAMGAPQTAAATVTIIGFIASTNALGKRAVGDGNAADAAVVRVRSMVRYSSSFGTLQKTLQNFAFPHHRSDLFSL